MPGLVIAATVLAVTAMAGLLWRRRSGRLRVPAPDRSAAAPRLPEGLVPASDAAVTLLHFSSATCAPCRRVRALCEDVAGDLSGVRHVELDAEAHLDAVRELSIWRLPTLLVVDREGQVARRTVGVPDRAALREAVEEVMA